MIQGLDVFMSKHDLESGARWSLQLAAELEQTNFGIVCLTPENLESPWLLFEAGALTKHLEGRACALLFSGLTPASVSGPLAQFQNRTFHKDDFRALLQDMNAKLPNQLGAKQLDMIFEKWWPDIERDSNLAMKRLAAVGGGAPRREQREILEEILTRIRDLERNLVRTETRARETAPHTEELQASMPKRLWTEVVRALSPDQLNSMKSIFGGSGNLPVELDEDFEQEYADVLQRLLTFGLIAKKDKFYRAHPFLADLLKRTGSLGEHKIES